MRKSSIILYFSFPTFSLPVQSEEMNLYSLYEKRLAKDFTFYGDFLYEHGITAVQLD